MALNFNIPSQVKSFPTMGDFPATGEAKTIYIALDTKLLYIYDSGAYTSIGDATSAEWGHISGDITSQTDLQTALDGKFNNPTGDSTQYLNGAGTPTTFPTFASADKMVTVGRNSTGATLYKGTIVYISGSTGNRPNFVKAQANAESTSAGTFGVIEADIANNADGNCVTIGTINDLDTRSSAPHPFTSDTLADGDTIYLSPTTAGYITKVKPSAPNHLVYLGKVVRTSPTNGTIVYRVQNGYELDEIHDVTTTNYTTPQDEDSVLTLDSTQLLWKRLTLFNLRVFLKTYFDTIYQSVITPGTTSQYYRGDKTFQTLDKTAVGLSNVDNTSDANKPVSTAQATAISLKENSANKATTMTGNTTSNTLFLTAKAIYDWATGLFQTILVSGTNIKTINGNTILGSGDLTISTGITIGSTAITSGTIGRILFEGTGNVVSESANLFWDNTNGRLGIGTSSPAYKLDVNGNIAVNNSVYVYSTAFSSYTRALYDDGSLSTILRGNTHLDFWSANNFRMRVNNAGNVLIGTTTDAGYKLDVNGTARVSGLILASGGLQFGSSGAEAYLNTIGTTAISINRKNIILSNGADNALTIEPGNGGGSIAKIWLGGFAGTQPLCFNGNGRESVFGLDTATPTTSALIRMESTTKGFLPPRMTSTQKNAIATPAAGLMVFDTTLNKLCVYTTTWETITSL